MKSVFAAIVLFSIISIALLSQSSNLYDRMGVITERGLHGAVPEENVDLFSGSVVLKNLDITLPGPNGFDLNVWRVYNSKVNTDFSSDGVAYPQQEHTSWVGYGWIMHMGRIHNPTSTRPSIEYPDGRKEATYSWIHDENILITRDFVKLKKYNPAYGGYHTLHFKDGSVWVFGASGFLFYPLATIDVALVTQMIDSYGHTISIEYYPNTTKLKKITDAFGRVVQFFLAGNGTLDYIEAPCSAGTATYNYDVGSSDFLYYDGKDFVFWLRTQLNSMTPPELNPVTYTYNSSFELYEVNTSYGGKITYNFGDQEFRYYDSTLRTRSLQSKTIQFATGNSSTWTYTYGDGISGHVNYDGTYTIDVLVNGQPVTVNAGYTTVIGPVTTEQTWFFGPDSEIEGWRAGTIASKMVLDGGVSIAYSEQLLESEQISNDNIIYRQTSWGKAKAILDAGSISTKIGDCLRGMSNKYEIAELRKYGLPSKTETLSEFNSSIQFSNPRQSLTAKLREARGLPRYRNQSVDPRLARPATEPITVYIACTKEYSYAFNSNHPSFLSLYMLTPVAEEKVFDGFSALYKDTKYEYFENGAISKTSRWVSGATWLDWIYTYAENGSAITITVDQPGAGGIETNIYENGTLKKVIKPGYVESDRTIYPDGLVHTETNQHGGTMTFSYDTISRITRIDMPAGFNPITAAWSQNSVVISRGGNTVTKYWDGMGRDLGTTETGAGLTLHSRRTLDGEGRLIAESKGATDPNHMMVYQLNPIGQPTQVTDPTGLWVRYAYANNTCTITDKKGNSKTLTYGYLPGLVTKVVQGGTETTYGFGGENWLGRVDMVGAGGETRVHSYNRNGMDQIIWETHPEFGAANYGTIDYSFNNEGNLYTKVWPDGTTHTYGYNASNQPTSESDGMEIITTTYDPLGRVSEIKGVEISIGTELWKRNGFSYNSLGAVTSETQAITGLPGVKSMAYAYDANGALQELTYPDGRKATYSSNTLMLPKTLAFNSLSQVSDVIYGVNKQPTSIAMGNNTLRTSTYDTAGRISSTALGSHFSITYSYDDAGNIMSLSNTIPSGNATFTYDLYNRLTGGNYTNAGKNYTYVYDSFGNMTSARMNGLETFAKTYTNQNRITGFAYDSRGNTLEDERFTYSWDNRNRMTRSYLGDSVNGILLGQYNYDSRGLRIRSYRRVQPSVQVTLPNGGESYAQGAVQNIHWSGAALTGTVKLELLVDGEVAGIIAENLPSTQTSYEWQVGQLLNGWVNPGGDYKVRVTTMGLANQWETLYSIYGCDGKLLSEYDALGACIRDNLYLGGKLVAEFQPSANKYYYYTSDQINSTRIVTDSSGNLVYSRQYDPYGGVLSTEVKVYEPKLGFSGKEREADSELDYFGARYYDHKWYRFNSVDPIINKKDAITNPQIWNLYAYCQSNPISNFDPDGRDVVPGIKLNPSREKEVANFIKKNKNDGGAIGWLINFFDSDKNYTILVEFNDIGQKRFYNKNDQTGGLILTDPKDSFTISRGPWAGQTQSPETGFGHELGHAFLHYFLRNIKFPGTQLTAYQLISKEFRILGFPNLNEMITTLVIGNIVAASKKEGLRTSY